MEKIKISEKLYCHIDIDSLLSGTLHDVANNILNIEQKLKTENPIVSKNPDKYIQFIIEPNFTYYDSELEVSGIRMETDEEYNKRIEKAAKQKIARQVAAQNKAKAEMELYLKLKKKYEK